MRQAYVESKSPWWSHGGCCHSNSQGQVLDYLYLRYWELLRLRSQNDGAGINSKSQTSNERVAVVQSTPPIVPKDVVQKRSFSEPMLRKMLRCLLSESSGCDQLLSWKNLLRKHHQPVFFVPRSANITGNKGTSKKIGSKN